MSCLVSLVLVFLLVVCLGLLVLSVVCLSVGSSVMFFLWVLVSCSFVVSACLSSHIALRATS